MSETTILVTGAAGMIGTQIVLEAVAAGQRVIAGVRSRWSAKHLPQSVEIAVGDVRDPEYLARAVRGTTHVVHAAATVDLSATYGELAETNVDSVRQLYRSCVDEGVEQFVFLSGAGIYNSSKGFLNEDSAAKAFSDYEQTKIDAEATLQNVRGPVPWTVLRPGLVYGPRGRALAGALAAYPALLFQYTMFLPGFRGGPRSNWVHAEDVARAVHFVLGREEAHNAVFNIADDHPVALGEILTLLASAQGLPIVGPNITWPPAPLLGPLLPILANPHILRWFNRLLARTWSRVRQEHGLEDAIVPRLDAGVLPYAVHDMIVRTDRLKKMGFELRYPSVVEGYPGVLDWYREASWLPDLRGVEVKPPKETGLRIRFHEGLVGYAMPTNDERTVLDVEANLEIDAPIRAFLDGREALIDGTISVQGICSDAPIEGTLRIQPISRRRVVYEFGFSAGGEVHRLNGEKAIAFSLRKQLASWSRLPFRIVDAKCQTTHTGEIRFDMVRDLVGSLVSYRVGHVRADP